MARTPEGPAFTSTSRPWEDEPRIPAGQAGGGRWTRGGGIAASAFRVASEKLGFSAPPRSHKANPFGFHANRPASTPYERALKQSITQAVKGVKTPEWKLTGDRTTDALIRRGLVQTGQKLLNTGLNVGATYGMNKILGSDAGSAEFVHKFSDSRVPNNPIGPAYNPFGFEAPQKTPTNYSTNDERGLKINVYVGKVNKKKRPTFPNGYRKASDLF